MSAIWEDCLTLRRLTWVDSGQTVDLSQRQLWHYARSRADRQLSANSGQIQPVCSAPNPVVPGYLVVARKQTFAHMRRKLLRCPVRVESGPQADVCWSTPSLSVAVYLISGDNAVVSKPTRACTLASDALRCATCRNSQVEFRLPRRLF